MLGTVLVTIASNAHAQDTQTVVIVKAPDRLEGVQVEVALNGTRLAGFTNSAGEARIVFPFLAEGPAQFRVVARRIGFSSRVWTNDMDLNGSGVIEYTFNPDGSGSIGQWPAVVWLAIGSTLDV